MRITRVMPGSPAEKGGLKAGDGFDHRQLHFLRKRGRDAVGIDQMGIEPFGFEKHLVTVPVGEAVDLVLD